MADRPELIVRAALFTVDPQFDGRVAAVAEERDGSGFALHFLRASGSEACCITTNEGNTADGAVAVWSRGPRHLDLDVHPEAARILCVPERFRLLLRADRAANERFLEGIATILDVPEDVDRG